MILAAIMPKIDPVAFYGPLGPIVDAATVHSEATRTGVAMQIVAQVGTMLRPFYIDLGDEKLPLNPFLIQCAPSAIGRKGTSAKFADTIIAPGIAAHAARVAFQIRIAEQDAARAAAAKAAAERAVADAEAQIAWAMTVTEEAKVAAEEKRDQAQADLDAVRARLNIWRKKLADTSLAPATLEIYMRSVTSAKREEANLEAAVTRAEADVARTAAALADRPAAIAVANEARRQALAALAGVKGSAAVNVEPWQRLYGRHHAGEPAQAVVRLDGLRAHVRAAPHRAPAHPVRRGCLRHDPAQAAQARGARPRLGQAGEVRHGVGLPVAGRMGPGSRPIAQRRRCLKSGSQPIPQPRKPSSSRPNRPRRPEPVPARFETSGRPSTTPHTYSPVRYAG